MLDRPLPAETTSCAADLQGFGSGPAVIDAVASVGDSLVKVPCLTSGGGACEVSGESVAVVVLTSCSKLFGRPVGL